MIKNILGWLNKKPAAVTPQADNRERIISRHEKGAIQYKSDKPEPAPFPSPAQVDIRNERARTSMTMKQIHLAPEQSFEGKTLRPEQIQYYAGQAETLKKEIKQAFGIYFSKEGTLKLKAQHLTARQKTIFSKFLTKRGLVYGQDFQVHEKNGGFSIVIAGAKAKDMVCDDLVAYDEKDESVQKIVDRILGRSHYLDVTVGDLRNRVHQKAKACLRGREERAMDGMLSYSFNKDEQEQIKILENSLRLMRSKSQQEVPIHAGAIKEGFNLSAGAKLFSALKSWVAPERPAIIRGAFPHALS